MDEFVWAVDQKFSGQGIFGTSPRLPCFAQLDNEPELWNTTHLEIQGPNPVTSDAYIAKTISLATALKTQFPTSLFSGRSTTAFTASTLGTGNSPRLPRATTGSPTNISPR